MRIALKWVPVYFCLGLALLLGIERLAEPVAANPAAEKALEAKIQGQLEAVLGPGKTKVTVSGKADGTRRQSRSVTHRNPHTAQERIVSETREGVTRRKVERVYTYDQTEALATEASGALKQKSVSVIYEPLVSPEDPENAVPPLDSAEIEEIVRTTANIDEAQGDRLHISQGKMDTSAYDRLKAEMEKARQGTPVWIYGLCALGGIVGGVGLGFFLARRRQRRQATPTWESTSSVSVYPGPLPADLVQIQALPASSTDPRRTNQALEQPRA